MSGRSLLAPPPAAKPRERARRRVLEVDAGHARDLRVPFSSWIVPISMQAAALILFVAVIDLPRRAWPQLRSALWRVVVMKLALLRRGP